jgi:serine/threonine protein kinase
LGDLFRSEKKKILDFSRLKEIAIEFLQAIVFLHSNNVVHGNLHPNNVLLGHDYFVKVSDSLFESSNEMYVAPETLHGISTPKSDVYSLGMILYELFTLTNPFSTVQMRDMMDFENWKRTWKPNFASLTISRDLILLLESCVSINPSDRPDASTILSRLF